MTGVHTSDVRTYYPYSPGKPPLFTLPRIRGGSFDLAAPGTADFSRGADLNLRDPRSYQWTFTVERTLPWSITGRVSYLGVQSTGMPIAADFNQLRASPQRFSPSRRPFPAWGHLFSFEALGFANYQGLQVEASRRFRGDAFFQASYVYSKNLGNFMQNWGGETSFPRETFFTSISDRFNTRLDRGNVGGSRRDRFLLTGLFPLPFGKGRRFGTQWTGTRNALLGGWELSTVTLVQSGPFQTPLSGFDRSNTDMWGRFAYPRPDRIGDGNLPNPTADRWYDRSAFREVPAGAGRFGNTGVGVLKASGTVAIAAGLAKTGALTEKIRLRVEVTFTNLPNHPNYGPPVVVLSAPNFGRVYTDQGGENSGHRTGQVGVRFDF
jgi:hypothetical protein